MKQIDKKELNDFYKNIKCIPCKSQNIYDSENYFAENLRNQIYKQRQNGMNFDEIEAVLIQKYGEEIIMTPIHADYLWYGPFVIFSLSLVLLCKRYML